MVWGGITDEDRTEMVILKGNLNAERYINDVLQPVVVSFVERHRTPSLWTLPHVLIAPELSIRFWRSTTTERMVPWSAHSPDMKRHVVFGRVAKLAGDFSDISRTVSFRK